MISRSRRNNNNNKKHAYAHRPRITGHERDERLNQSRGTQSVLRETNSMELSIVQNNLSVALRSLQLF